MMTTKEIYLDNAATTQPDPSVLVLMQTNYGNPSSLHAVGHRAQSALENARKALATILLCDPEELIFTSGGTESNNLVLFGAAKALQHKGKHIITTQIEHASVLAACAQLELMGYDITYLPVDDTGRVSPEVLEKAITEQTILISIMHANNEVGTIQSLDELAAIAQRHHIYFHTDAVQSFTKVPLALDTLPVSFCSLSGHKIHGPKGIGALFIRKGTVINPLLFGGQQEAGLRPGTENVPAICAFAAAAQLPVDTARMQRLRNQLMNGLLTLPQTKLNGSQVFRLPNNVNISFAGVEAETLLHHLNAAGIMASMGSACHAHTLEPSHVLKALGLSNEYALGTIRLTLSKDTTETDILYTLRIIKETVTALRALTK